jgi:hypothetical protein
MIQIYVIDGHPHSENTTSTSAPLIGTGNVLEHRYDTPSGTLTMNVSPEEQSVY